MQSPPPEFFADRSLGKNVIAELRSRGWRIHRITDHFPNDAQEIDDPVWMRYGLGKGWFPLHKDAGIKRRDIEREPLIEHRSPMFYLDNQQLPIAEMVERFDQNRVGIFHRAVTGKAACYAVGEHGLRRTWP